MYVYKYSFSRINSTCNIVYMYMQHMNSIMEHWFGRILEYVQNFCIPLYMYLHTIVKNMDSAKVFITQRSTKQAFKSDL